MDKVLLKVQKLPQMRGVSLYTFSVSSLRCNLSQLSTLQMHHTQTRVGTDTGVKICKRRLWEQHKWKVWKPPARAGSCEAKQCQELFLRIPAADLPLPTTASFPTSPPRSHQTEASAAGTPGQSRRTGSGHGSSTDCQNGFYRRTEQNVTERHNTNPIQTMEKCYYCREKKRQCLCGKSTQLYCSPCSSKPERLHIICLLDGLWNELGTVLSMEIVQERIKQQKDIREYANNYIVQPSIRQHSILFRAMLTLLG